MKTAKQKERIMHAAVMAETGWIFIGKCHADCFHKLDNIGLEPYHSAHGQGFVTNLGRFVFRDKAAAIAHTVGQVDRLADILCSEDLWSEEYDGKYTYDEICGYVLKPKINSKTSDSQDDVSSVKQREARNGRN